MAMTRKQQRFLMETLPEFILREEGRGFCMEQWVVTRNPGDSEFFDAIQRPIPSCGTVACIGGSAALLLGQVATSEEVFANFKRTGRRLGLTTQESRGLFSNWEMEDLGATATCAWPKKYMIRYAKADTPLEKAKIAAELCKLVGQTKGKCLHLKAVKL